MTIDTKKLEGWEDEFFAPHDWAPDALTHDFARHVAVRFAERERDIHQMLLNTPRQAAPKFAVWIRGHIDRLNADIQALQASDEGDAVDTSAEDEARQDQLDGRIE